LAEKIELFARTGETIADRITDPFGDVWRV